MSARKRLVIGISGASGAAIALELLRLCKALKLETFTTVSAAAERTIQLELGEAARKEIHDLATQEYAVSDVAAAISSGSYPVDAMIVAPCSMRSLAAIAYGTGEGLLARAADVTLKERRPLVLLAREAPLHEGHLEAMLKVTRMGAIVAPPVPPFYLGLSTLEDMTWQIAARALAMAGVDPGNALQRWTGDPA
ncbi:UbiX family flavin prenyltransferase [Roseibium aggregatum]|uniref:UbiX family flavin prenyltransferase n=1 Tax=Roseibium aggregatum TaxID=187304 RepID=UPI003A9832D2